MNAKTVKDALIKRIVHAVKAIEKCRYQRNLLSKEEIVRKHHIA